MHAHLLAAAHSCGWTCQYRTGYEDGLHGKTPPGGWGKVSLDFLILAALIVLLLRAATRRRRGGR